MDLGKIGIWTRDRGAPELAPELEALGYGALWIGSSPSLAQVRPFLERYCFSCHGAKKPEAMLDLSRDASVQAIFVMDNLAAQLTSLGAAAKASA